MVAVLPARVPKYERVKEDLPDAQEITNLYTHQISIVSSGGVNERASSGICIVAVCQNNIFV